MITEATSTRGWNNDLSVTRGRQVGVDLDEMGNRTVRRSQSRGYVLNFRRIDEEL
jgi:hypothetical protein